MLFNSFEFALFLPAIWVLYWCAAPVRFRQPLLTVASLLFYGWWDWRFVPLITGLSAIAWLMAIAASDEGRARSKGWRWTVTVAGIVIPLLVLGFFKYASFLLSIGEQVFAAFGRHFTSPALNIILPVGISFYTFQCLSYVIDVRRGHCKAERSFWKVLLYISFFPQLIAGPIVSARTFLPQLQQPQQLSSPHFVDGIRLVLWGLMLKVVFGDSLATWANPVFDSPEAFTMPARWAGVLAFYGQIYFDFSGYSTMAVGLGKTFNLELPPNFNLPYSAQSITDFWRRWHITLSNWLRDYLFIPLGGNRSHYLRNLMITMILGGLWHGASWNFVLWGVLHGVALCLHKLWAGSSSAGTPARSLPGLPAWLLTQVFILVSWVPFRAADFSDTLLYFTDWSGGELSAPGCAITWPWLVAPLLIDALMHRRMWTNSTPPETQGTQWLTPVRLGVTAGLALLLVLALGTWNSGAFIYFQF